MQEPVPPAALDALLRLAKQLIRIHHPEDVLVRVAEEAQRLTGARAVFATHVPTGTPWERGLQVAVQGGARAATAVERSALFAVHRRLAAARAPLALGYEEAHDGLFRGLAGADATEVHLCAVPICRSGGRLVGELALVLVTPLPPASAALLGELADIAGATLEAAQRLVRARHEQERLHLLAEASEEALWDWNPQTGEFWWGGGIRNILGRGGEAVQNSLRWKMERTHPDDLPRVRDALNQALISTQSSWVAEYRFRRADDSWIVVEDRGYFLREADGRAYRLVGSVRDITPMKRLLENEQRARAEAEQASRAKDEFLALLGHELRNPLSPIVTAVHLLKLRGIDAIERERSIIERQANHMVRLVDDLLDVSRITRGMIRLNPERGELAPLVAKAIEMASPLIEERRHYLDVQVPASGLVIEADPARFAQVVANLLTNAAKYTESGGRITISAARVGDEVELQVRDTGIGIAPEIQPHIFDMFVQEQQALDRARGGLGLGLSIVRSLVALHGGRVGLTSAGRGKGSCFSIRMPALSPAAIAPAPVEAIATARAQDAGRRVLVVDDNQDAAELLAAWLESQGDRVRIAHDGLAALRMAEEFQPAIVLLDIGLPVLDGYQVARLLREQPGGEQLCVIAVTGYGQDRRQDAAEAAGFDAHLVKPVSLELLEATLRGLAEHAQPVAPPPALARL